MGKNIRNCVVKTTSTSSFLIILSYFQPFSLFYLGIFVKKTNIFEEMVSFSFLKLAEDSLSHYLYIASTANFPIFYLPQKGWLNFKYLEKSKRLN